MCARARARVRTCLYVHIHYVTHVCICICQRSIYFYIIHIHSCCTITVLDQIPRYRNLSGRVEASRLEAERNIRGQVDSQFTAGCLKESLCAGLFFSKQAHRLYDFTKSSSHLVRAFALRAFQDRKGSTKQDLPDFLNPFEPV